jgi:putative ABC transport system substrate-binding protein
VAVIASAGSADYALVAKELERAAERLGIKIQQIDIAKLDVQTAFREAATGRAEAVLFRVPGPVLNPRRPEIGSLAVKSGLPVIYEGAQEVEAGGLMSYGINAKELYKRAATYVDKILKGAKPADLPVEQPTNLELVVNLKTAKQIGLTIPANVLARADRVIK